MTQSTPLARARADHSGAARAYRLGWLPRRALRALVEAFKPRWPELDPPIEERVVARIERDLSRFPRSARAIVIGALLVLELGAVVYWAGLVPTSTLALPARERRLRTMSARRGALRRGAFAIWRTHILLTCYDMAEVREFLGMNGPDWQSSRRALRERLVAAHPPETALAPPARLDTALVAGPLVAGPGALLDARLTESSKVEATS